VVDRALAQAEAGLTDLTGVAVTAGPGLVGALLVGVMYGKTLARVLEVPLIGVHHLEGHLLAPLLESPDLTPPLVALLVSGGHTLLLGVADWGSYRLLGATRDDAAGEAFDKVAAALGLPYPGGPAVERLAKAGDPSRYHFPRPMLQHLQESGPDRFAFSFSGLKTAVVRAASASPDLARDRADLARGFQDAAVEVLVEKAAAAIELLDYQTLVLGGGVACNQALVAGARDRLGGEIRLAVASARLNTDNAAMIGAAGLFRLARGERSGYDLEPSADLPFPGLVTIPEPMETAR
jgi:N6-L-threonylcarbamoyladenine synthase